MRAWSYKAFVLSAFVLACSLGLFAQASGDPKGARPLSGSMLVGEVLTYEAKVNKILHGISVAGLTLTTAAMPNSTDLSIKAEAVSKGTLLKIFRYSFLQQYESTLDPTFRILKTVKHDVQKERVRDSEAIFDYGRKMVTFVETDPKDGSRPPRRIAADIGEHVLDMVSAIYYLRLQPLAIGKHFDISVSDSGVVYSVPVAVTAREQQKTEIGNVWCYRIEPEIFGPGRLIEQKGNMVIWMTDDARHIPVRSQIDASIGRIDIKLKTASPSK